MNKQIKSHLFFLIGLMACIFVVQTQTVSAYTIEKLNFSNEGDIVIGPGKTEVLLSPGETFNQEIIVSNRSGAQKIIDISVEDFQGTKNPDETVQFLGSQKGPYSLKDYVKPEINQITLNFGERLRLPVVISIPETATPGGLYGAVMISASNIAEADSNVTQNATAGKVKIITRVASLFFVRVKGDVINDGSLKDFKTAKNLYESGPITFQILSENNGSVYLSPYGAIEVKNMLGQKIDERQIDPWFVMPNAIRERDVLWNSDYLFGRYTATLLINRGYDDIIDTKTISFWVIPWKILSIILIGLILVIWFFVWVASHIQWKGKPSNPAPQQNFNPPAAPPPPVLPKNPENSSTQ